ncbi:MAG: LptF/LptG family permease [Candidatus Omnitrophota bacterium]
MRILEKYVLKSFIGSFLFCIVLLIVLGIIGDILGFIDDIFKNNIPLGSILLFYFYLAPFAFVNMVPFACLLSAVYVFNSLSKNQEVTAFITSGLSLWKLLRPVLLTTFAICLVTFIVNDKYVPSTMEKSSRIRQEKLETTDGKTGSEMKDLAICGKGDQIIYARSFNPGTNVLKDVIIHRQDSSRRITGKVCAQEVKWEPAEGWVGEGVIAFHVDADGKFKGEPEVLERKRLLIYETPEDFRNNQWDPKFMSYGQLKDYLNGFPGGLKNTVRRLQVDLNYKLALPFTALIVVLMGVPFSIETGRSNALLGMARGILAGILYLPVMAVSLALGKSGVLPPLVSAWSANILFAGIGIYFVNKKS